MKTLDFNAIAEAADKDPGLQITSLDGEKIQLRKFENLPGDDFKTVMKLINIIQDEKVGQDAKLDAMDQCLVAASDKKESMKYSLARLPLSARNEAFDAWMDSDEVGNS
ncbi:hypothetical protein ABZV77_11580 [Streptomyces sp. NPDC004732]|uniref:hypothetical protein n=1 Tax=Streptomyces sp. NPDC004732 TaxID=3154290 RepID=UPI0033A3A858